MNRENLVEQHSFIIDNPFISKSIKFDNLIIQSTSEETKWIEELTNKIGDWRGIFRSAYIKWAVTINGLCLAKEKYEKIKVDADFVFKIHSLRQVNGDLIQSSIAEWDGPTTAKVHFDTRPMICTYGFTDLYNCLEEFVFDFYRTYWRHFPENLIKGSDFKDLRKLKAESGNDEESASKWVRALNDRLNNWQRKRLYDNLGKVFLAFCNEVGLKKPENYVTTPENWAESITGISLVRNIIVHGGKYVTKELSDFCTKPHSLGFRFKEGEELKIDLIKLQSVELFLHQLLSAINIALVEKSRKTDNK